MNNKEPVGWKAVTYAGQAIFSMDKGGRSGTCLKIEVTGDGADASWTAQVAVKPLTNYRLKGWIRIDGIAGASGALFNIHDTSEKTAAAKGDNKKWREFTIDYATKKETSVVINCLFGGWGKSTGVARFDDVSLTEIGGTSSA